MIERIRRWWLELTCKHVLDARMKWVEEFAIYYEECIICGREFYE